MMVDKVNHVRYAINDTQCHEIKKKIDIFNTLKYEIVDYGK